MKNEWEKLKEWIEASSDKNPLDAPPQYQGNEHFAWADGWDFCIEALREAVRRIEEKRDEREKHKA